MKWVGPIVISGEYIILPPYNSVRKRILNVVVKLWLTCKGGLMANNPEETMKNLEMSGVPPWGSFATEVLRDEVP